jgi:hypothetical protein
MNRALPATIPVRLRRASRTGLLVSAAAVTALMAAACSSSSSTPPAAGSGGGAGAGAGAAGTGGTSSSKPVQFAKCMRSHGLTNFPDPSAQGTFNLPNNMTSSAQFASADHACRSLAPAGPLSGQGPTAKQLDQTVKFVACMRKHGVPKFPDPGANGQFQLQGGANPIDPSAPQFKSAMNACHALLPPGIGFGTGG